MAVCPLAANGVADFLQGGDDLGHKLAGLINDLAHQINISVRELGERLHPKPFAITRANCRGEAVDKMRRELDEDIATFVIELPAD